MLRWPKPDIPMYSHFLLWPPELRLEYEERAAVYEFDGMLSRQDAERRAFGAARAVFDELLATQPRYPPHLRPYVGE